MLTNRKSIKEFIAGEEYKFRIQRCEFIIRELPRGKKGEAKRRASIFLNDYKNVGGQDTFFAFKNINELPK